MAALTIQGPHLDLENISSTLGIEPSHNHKVGDLIAKHSKRKHKHDMWSVDAPLDKQKPMDEHLNWLAQHLRPHYDFIRSLKSQDEVEIYVYCGFTFYDFEAGLSLSPEALSIFTDLGISMEVSVLVG